MRVFRICDCGEEIRMSTEHSDGEARFIFQHGFHCRLTREPEMRAAGCNCIEAVGDVFVLPWLRSLEGDHGFDPFPSQ